METQELGIYIHIPFCVRKCLYCDFLSFPAGEEEKKLYVQALLKEVDAACDKFGFLPEQYEPRTIYFGGGTPSILDEVYINEILCKLYDRFRIDPSSLEITLEANPGTVNAEKLAAYQRAGVNRLSIGLQSADEGLLRILGRIHTFEDFKRSYESAREAGFQNINVDIMTALPGQSRALLEDTLCKLIEFSPDHISAYSLILEKGTPFYVTYHPDDAVSPGRIISDPERIPAGSLNEDHSEKTAKSRLASPKALPDEEAERAQYYMVRDHLKQAGYERYEISNFARKGFESRHNTACWKRIPYLGLGLGASGFLNEIRFQNTIDLKTYLQNSHCQASLAEKRPLARYEQIEETMFLGLRMQEGVSKAAFKKTFGASVESFYEKELIRLKKDGLILDNDERICLTDRGIDYGNYVFSRFLFE
ncbi:MAG: radical SAM protein [Lachnospiraceae bacterium]|nr:radical SAM protein [Lachnospiraceae bacterium]